MLILKCGRDGEAHFNSAEHNVNTGILLFEALHKSSPDWSGFSMYLTPPGQFRKVTGRRVNRPWISRTGTGRSAAQAAKVAEPTLTKERRNPASQAGRKEQAQKRRAVSMPDLQKAIDRGRNGKDCGRSQSSHRRYPGLHLRQLQYWAGPFQKRPGLSEGCAGLYSGTGVSAGIRAFPASNRDYFSYTLVLIQKAPHKSIAYLPGPP